MKTKQKILCIVLGVLCTVTLLPWYLRFTRNSGRIPDQVYITAAHLPHDSVMGYTFMYEDTDRDTAYYIKNDYTYHYPTVGDTVYFADSKATVDTIVSGTGFYVTVTGDTEIYKGLSGARVKNANGKDIAFISAAKGRNKLLCISTY